MENENYELIPVPNTNDQHNVVKWTENRELKGVNMVRGKNSLLSIEQYRFLVEAISVPAQANRIARSLFEVKNVGGLGIQVYSYDRLTEMGPATIDEVIVGKFDTINKTRINVPIPIIQAAFRVELRDIQSNPQAGEPISTTLANSAGRSIADAEETMLLIGSGVHNGLFNSAGNTFGGADFGTFGNATTTVQGALDLLFADDITGPFNMVLHPTQWSQLAASQSATGVRELPTIMDLLKGGSNGTGSIVMSRFVTAATGMMVAAPGNGYIELAMAQDLTTRDFDINGGATGVHVFETLMPTIKETNAICNLTAI